MNHSVVAIIFREDKQEVLCIQRRDISIWAIPGGVVDPGETPEEAVVREVKEETGLDVVIERKVAEYKPIQIISTITHAFECTPIRGTPKVTNEVIDVGYFPIHKLPQLFFQVHEGWIHEALELHQEIIKRDLTEVTWIKFIQYILKHPIYFTRFLLAKGLGIRK